MASMREEKKEEGTSRSHIRAPTGLPWASRTGLRHREPSSINASATRSKEEMHASPLPIQSLKFALLCLLVVATASFGVLVAVGPKRTTAIPPAGAAASSPLKRNVETVTMFTSDELKKYDGSAGPIYLVTILYETNFWLLTRPFQSILGMVFDVTKGLESLTLTIASTSPLAKRFCTCNACGRAKHYDKDGGYSGFAGRDASRSFVSGRWLAVLMHLSFVGGKP